ncbi:Uncharacterised protein [uncultured archaeon]|nr:Uncharacterised protein [uncultured archaeon]
MLVTTGKKPDAASRSIAQALFLSVPGATMENRGSRPLSALISKAKKRRFTRLCTIYREEGRPSTIAFLSLSDAGFEWLSPKIEITKVAALPPKKRMQQATELRIKGAKAKALQKLIEPLNQSGGQAATITAGARKLTIHLGRKKILELGVEYAK